MQSGETVEKMKRIINLFFWFLPLILPVNMYGKSNYEISILTCESGKEIYTSFGHSAIRIVNRDMNIDDVYNFGVFDFSTPHFYLKFIRGNLKYYVEKTTTQQFLSAYSYENRLVFEQKLCLPTEKTQKIVIQLENLILPNNKYYRYEFLRRNCTTELRELIDIKSGYDNSFLLSETNHTYRSCINSYLDNNLWVKEGINLVLGSSVDKRINNFETMFLPEFFSSGLNELTTNKGKKLVYKSSCLNAKKEELTIHALFSPTIIILLFCIIVFLIRSKTLDMIFLGVIGLIGLLLFFISFYSRHTELITNFNLLWCNPILVLFIGNYLFLKKERFHKIVIAILLTCVLLLICIWILRIQSFEASHIIISVSIVILLIRNINLKINMEQIQFGATADEIDDLTRKVIIGEKIATSSLHDYYLIGKKEQSKVGDVFSILNSTKEEVTRVEITKVELVKFGNITEQFAKEEGDGNLENWLVIHQPYYGKSLAKIGKELNLEILLVCEWFKVVD